MRGRRTSAYCAFVFFMEERLQKILARAGVGSRRECEKIIEQGCVTINGECVTEAGIKIDPEACSIKVYGKLVRIPDREKTYRYLILNKPKGVLSTMKPDPKGRPTLLDLIRKKVKSRVFPVGRLDFNSEGLVLLTDDGELAYRLTHPKFKLPKIYEVKVHGIPSRRILNILADGVNLEDGRTRPAKVKLLKTTGKNAWLLFTLHEGKKRQIRRMCEKVRFPVSKLKRTMIGPIKLTELKTGQVRYLSDEEILKLKQEVKLI